MEIIWEQVPSDTIRTTTGGAIEVVEPVTEPVSPVMPDEAVRLYVVFTKSDNATLEQQVAALAETVELSVRLYDTTGNAAVIQTTARYISVIEHASEVAEVRREFEAELHLDSTTVGQESDTKDIPDQTESNPVQSDAGKAANESESVETDVTVGTEAGNEITQSVPALSDADSSASTESVEADEATGADIGGEITQSVQVAEDVSETDTQGILGEDEQIAQTTEVLVTPMPAQAGKTGSTFVFAVLGCFIILVVSFLVIRRK